MTTFAVYFQIVQLDVRCVSTLFRTLLMLFFLTCTSARSDKRRLAADCRERRQASSECPQCDVRGEDVLPARIWLDSRRALAELQIGITSYPPLLLSLKVDALEVPATALHVRHHVTIASERGVLCLVQSGFGLRLAGPFAAISSTTFAEPRRSKPPSAGRAMRTDRRRCCPQQCSDGCPVLSAVVDRRGAILSRNYLGPDTALVAELDAAVGGGNARRRRGAPNAPKI